MFACAKAACKGIALFRDKKLVDFVDSDFKLIMKVYRDEKTIQAWLTKHMNIREPSEFDATEFLITLWVAWRIDKLIEPKDFEAGLQDFAPVVISCEPEKVVLILNGTVKGPLPMRVYLHTSNKTKIEGTLKDYMNYLDADYVAPKAGDKFTIKLKPK